MIDLEYTNNKNIERYLEVTAYVQDTRPYILATQRYIEEYTGRVFRADTVASARLYDGNGSQKLTIDDAIEITTVEVGTDMWGDSFSSVGTSGADRYYTLPTNNSANELPITGILLRSRIFINGHANHRITAKWGYSETPPEDLTWAATVLASGMYYANRGENTGPIKSEKIGEYSVSYGDSQGLKDYDKAMDIINSYRKLTI
jgi:hypothetical protein